MAVCPGVEGEFGVLPQHVSMLSALKIGDLRYRVNGKDENVFISGGFADVTNNVLSVLAESAELATDIDTARAQAAKERPKNACPRTTTAWTRRGPRPPCNARSRACRWRNCADVHCLRCIKSRRHCLRLSFYKFCA